MSFERYAVYFAPPAGHPLAAFGRDWLGWDAVAGEACERASVDVLTEEQWRRFTEAPRRYGFHGTLKPPLRLSEGETVEAFAGAVASLARRKEPFLLGRLRLARLGRFLALIPSDPPSDLALLARDCVMELDRFRTPASDAELARRRKAGLTSRQEEYLMRWGYPYVLDEFRFHLTVSSALADSEIDVVQPVLERLLEPVLIQPVAVSEICLFGDPGSGANFKLLQRFPFGAATDGA